MASRTSRKIESNLDKPQCNSTLRLVNKLDQLQATHRNNIEDSFQIDEHQLGKINEKASAKLNMQGRVFGGLVSVEPDHDDFLKFLEIKHKNLVKQAPRSNSLKSDVSAPDLMDFYPDDLIKEYPEIEIDPIKPPKVQTMKAAMYVTNNPINNYFKWN